MEEDPTAYIPSYKCQPKVDRLITKSQRCVYARHDGSFNRLDSSRPQLMPVFTESFYYLRLVRSRTSSSLLRYTSRETSCHYYGSNCLGVIDRKQLSDTWVEKFQKPPKLPSTFTIPELNSLYKHDFSHYVIKRVNPIFCNTCNLPFSKLRLNHEVGVPHDPRLYQCTKCFSPSLASWTYPFLPYGEVPTSNFTIPQLASKIQTSAKMDCIENNHQAHLRAKKAKVDGCPLCRTFQSTHDLHVIKGVPYLQSCEICRVGLAQQMAQACSQKTNVFRPTLASGVF
uniref:Uncharacterized protein n=1 Tax=Yado-kari virus 1 TaxID=1148496 RepID=J7M899_9VIRU|nr:hypothetical protein [Yado-kari virus 1]